MDYVNGLIEDFVPLCGDRLFADDATMIGGIGRFEGVSVVVLGQEKGRDLETRSNITSVWPSRKAIAKRNA